MTNPAAWLLAALAVTLTVRSVARADPARGERVFQRCYACHSIVAGEDTLPGPNLKSHARRSTSTSPIPSAPSPAPR